MNDESKERSVLRLLNFIGPFLGLALVLGLFSAESRSSRIPLHDNKSQTDFPSNHDSRYRCVRHDHDHHQRRN